MLSGWNNSSTASNNESNSSSTASNNESNNDAAKIDKIRKNIQDIIRNGQTIFGYGPSFDKLVEINKKNEEKVPYYLDLCADAETKFEKRNCILELNKLQYVKDKTKRLQVIKLRDSLLAEVEKMNKK